MTRQSLAAPLVAVCLLLGWELAVGLGAVSGFFFPAPSAVLAAVRDGLREGTLGRDAATTLRRLTLALGLGGGAGLLCGLAAGSSSRLRAALEPAVAAVHPLPKLALYPLLLVLLGLGEASLVVVPALSSFFPMFISSVAGVREIRPVYFDVARTCGARRRDQFLHVVVPGSLPLVLAGARLALNSAFVVTIGVEMLSAPSGLGSQLWLSRETLRTEWTWGLLGVVSLLGASLSGALYWLGSRLTPWQPAPRA